MMSFNRNLIKPKQTTLREKEEEDEDEEEEEEQQQQQILKTFIWF